MIQGAAVVTMVLNLVALVEAGGPEPGTTAPDRERPAFAPPGVRSWKGGRATRLLVAVGLGTAAFSMQDILLEPYGGEILHLSVAATTALTALLAGGTSSASPWQPRCSAAAATRTGLPPWAPLAGLAGVHRRAVRGPA